MFAYSNKQKKASCQCRQVSGVGKERKIAAKKSLQKSKKNEAFACCKCISFEVSK